jgi:hypothetical protein
MKCDKHLEDNHETIPNKECSSRSSY